MDQQGTTTSERAAADTPVDTSVIKVDSRHSPRGESGQLYLA